MKLGIISLGCAKNLYDSEMILGILKKNNVEIVNNTNEADVILINTCGFIESAKEEAINTIFEMLELKKRYNKKIVVTGCLVERYLDTLKEEIPEVDLFIPIHSYKDFGKIFSELFNVKMDDNALSPTMRLYSTPKHWSYLRIADGCDNRCTYCAIPLIRKNHRSREIEDILIEANDIANRGSKEIVLISQDTTRFGKDTHGKCLLPELLEKLAQMNKFEFIRFLYLYPDEIEEELIDVVNKYESITPYFDVPIQHASSKVLKDMNRRGNKEFLIKLFKNIKNKIPNAILRTTLIVGFPGETEEDFVELKEFIQEIKFDRLGVFKYSPEEDTLSATFDNQIEEEVKERRYSEIMKLQEKISYSLSKEKIGEVQKVIIEGYDSKLKYYTGRSYAFAPDDVDGIIYIKSNNNLLEGDIINVKITSNMTHDLIGEEI